MGTNVLYIFADQWRVQAVGHMGEDQVITPNIDGFAAESMRFTNAYSTFPLCSPHRASLMTGRYPFQVGMWTNCKIGLEEKIMLKPQETCIGNVLKDNGYKTGYIGKWHLDAPELNFNPHPASGAREWDAYTPPGERRQGFDYWLSYGADDNHLSPHYWENSEAQICPGRWSAEFETDKAIEFMKAQAALDAPFALFLSYNPPHLPYELVPDRYFERFKDLKIHYRDNVPEEMRGEELERISRQYFAAIAGIDEQFGRICQFLKDYHLEENTIVVLSADHGEMLGSHGLMSKNVWYEESIHIPLYIRQKGRIHPQDNDVMFASPDHMPTVLELAGLPIPETCEGYSHVKGMFGEDQKAPADMLICSYPGGAKMVEKFSRLGLSHKAYGWRGIKTHEYTYVIINGYEPGEAQRQYLYDSRTDKYEENPEEILVGQDSVNPVVSELRERLKHYLQLTNDPFLFHREMHPMK